MDKYSLVSKSFNKSLMSSIENFYLNFLKLLLVEGQISCFILTLQPFH